jgi:hypothetical protein
MKNAIRSVEKALQVRGTASAAIEYLVKPVHELARDVETGGIWANALILLRSAEVFRYFLLYRRVPELESVEERFQVRPLLSACWG